MGRPRPVREVMALLGSSPLIAMPLDASNAGKNYGTGGDFTANSAPYVGARGASEFWARSAKFDGSTGYLSRGALTGAVDSKTFSFVFFLYPEGSIAGGTAWLSMSGSGTPKGIYITNTNTNMRFQAFNSSGTQILSAICGSSFVQAPTIVMVCIDLNNSSNRRIYINGVLDTTSWDVYTNALVPMTTQTDVRLHRTEGNLYAKGTSSMWYITTDYIDFSQEANRLKFVDAFNMPTDIGKKIEEGVIPKPLIYLPFDDPTNLGKNLGTGGNFTVNGTVTQGSDVLV